MANALAVLFRFRQLIFEYGPFFLVTWLGLAVTTGLIMAAQRKGIDLVAPSSSFLKYRALRWMYRTLFFWLWHPGGKGPGLPTFSGPLLFSLVASIPGLVATSLIGMKIVLLRLILAAFFAPSFNWFLTSIVLPKRGNRGGQRLEAESAFWPKALSDDSSLSPPRRLPSIAQVVRKSFISQIEGAVIPLVISLSLASALTVYVPTYAVHPWLGEGAWQGPYLAAFLAMPFQLAGGAEVLLASALLVNGATLGTALNIMLAAPSITFPVIRRLCQPMSVRTVALYLAATWLTAGSLGVTVDGVQRLLSV